MPRKTKKEKMASQLRRLKQVTESGAPLDKPEHPIGIPVSNITYKVNLKSPPGLQSNNEKTSMSLQDYSYIYKDLRLVGVLVVIMIVLELGLNLTLRTDFAKLLLSNFGIEI